MKGGNISLLPFFSFCIGETLLRMVLESRAGRALLAAVQPLSRRAAACAPGCVCRSLYAHAAELLSERLSCLIAAAPEVGIVLHARTSPDLLLEKVFSGNWFLPKALFVLPVPGDTESKGCCFTCLSEHHQRAFCRGSSPRILLSAVLPNNFPNAICTPSRVLLQALTAQREYCGSFLS